jgi:hypothetical protein
MKIKSLILLALFWATMLLADTKSDSHDTFVLNNFTFARPRSWQWEEINPQKDPTAVLRYVDKKTKEMARIVMIHYPPNAGLGKRAAALKRWQEAFLAGELATNQQTIGSHVLTFAEVAGVHKGEKTGGQGGPLPDWALIGAVIEDEQGNIVTKMTGPKAAVQKCKADFQKMMEQAVKKRSPKH